MRYRVFSFPRINNKDLAFKFKTKTVIRTYFAVGRVSSEFC